MTAVAVITLFATSAYSSELTFVGNTEYAVEAESFAVEAGAEIVANQFTFTTVAQFDDAVSWDFTGVEMKVSTPMTRNVSLYTQLQLDRDINYDEVTVGAAFRF